MTGSQNGGGVSKTGSTGPMAASVPCARACRRGIEPVRARQLVVVDEGDVVMPGFRASAERGVAGECQALPRLVRETNSETERAAGGLPCRACVAGNTVIDDHDFDAGIRQAAQALAIESREERREPGGAMIGANADGNAPLISCRVGGCWSLRREPVGRRLGSEARQQLPGSVDERPRDPRRFASVRAWRRPCADGDLACRDERAAIGACGCPHLVVVAKRFDAELCRASAAVARCRSPAGARTAIRRARDICTGSRTRRRSARLRAGTTGRDGSPRR